MTQTGRKVQAVTASPQTSTPQPTRSHEDRKPGRLPAAQHRPRGPRASDGFEDPGTGVVVKPRTRTKRPSMYKVLLLNDDYTPMEFVVHVLQRFFRKSEAEATEIMLKVHRQGVGVCGVYTYEIAETKVSQVMDLARKHQHPLQCTMEKD